ncbi:TraM recognition domain-containing protein [Gaetbulibacter sp. M240]|uniref:TraM recognition domain-containing protein n=1 Tax=Gaetbulibacter sp. M240 TaxID=3126511 RepID=UPI00374F0BEE
MKALTNEPISILIVSFFLLGVIYFFTILHNKFKVGILNSLITIGVIQLVGLAIPYLFVAECILGVIFLFLLLFRLFKPSKRKPKQKNNFNDEESFFLRSSLGTIQIANPFRGIIIEGGAGSGKSKSLFYPIIKQMMIREYTGVLYDFKSPELSEFAHAIHSELNSKVKFSFLDFKDHSRSSRINPIHPKYVNKQAVAFELASVLMNNLLPENIKHPDYWSRSSISIVAGVIWYLRNNHPDKCTLPHLIALILSYKSISIIDLISKDLECIGMISSIKEAHEMKAEKQLAGVIGTIKNALAQLNFPELFYLLSDDQVDLDLNNRENPTFLCIGNDSTLTTTYAPIISLVISVCLRKMNEPNKVKSAVVLDEAPTLYIPNLEQIPATARSNKIATIIGLQDYSQMVDKYGQDKAQVLISNLGNQFYGRTVNERTARMITALFGKEDRKYVSSSTSSGSSSGNGFIGNSSTNRGTTESFQERERVKVSDITNLPAGKFYGIVAEGNCTELLGVQMKQTEPIYKSFENRNIEENISDCFKTIYREVEAFLNGKPEDDEQIDNNFKIELN